jgi:tetratricopeptide (TPR) repeat protein
MFDALGFLFIVAGQFVVRHVLYVDFWGRLLFGEYAGGPSSMLLRAYGFAHLYLLITALLCWLTASGMKRDKRWARPVGIVTSVLLLVGLPWLTIAGAIGLWEFSTKSSRRAPADAAPAKPTTDFWNSKRKSKAQQVVLTILWMAAFVIQAPFEMYAKRTGMPVWRSGWTWWLGFLGFIFVQTALHEWGHTIVAWAVGFKVQVISIGPFAFWRGQSGFQFRFDLGRLFESGGYTGAIPVSDRNLRINQIAVVAAGPAVNALTCLALLAVFYSLPGTAWQSWWWVVSFNAVIAGVMAVGNLIPLGYCDGTMLLHLILWTPAGRLLLDRQRLLQMALEADECHGRADFDKEIELKETMLQRSLAFGQDNAFMIAACHQGLGTAYGVVDDWPAAEFQYRKCLECQAEVAGSPALAGNVWSGFFRVAVRRHHISAAGPACASVVAILEKQKTSGAEVTGPAVTFTMLAQAHLYNGDFQAALGEIGQALNSLPGGPNSISLRAHVLRYKAVCHLHLGEIETGLDVARSAADLFRSPETPAARRNLAWEDIADLGDELWPTGQSTLPIELMREGVAHLESGGAASTAGRYRVKLAAMLRQCGLADEARRELPAEPAQPPNLRRAFLAERAELRLLANRPDLAMADCRELVDLWRAHPYAPAPEIASAEGLLARACLAAGEFVEAEALAKGAYELLAAWQHPDAADCLVTLALARAQSSGEASADRIAEAFRLIDTAALLAPAEKARLKEAETVRIAKSTVAVGPAV